MIIIYFLLISLLISLYFVWKFYAGYSEMDTLYYLLDKNYSTIKNEYTELREENEELKLRITLYEQKSNSTTKDTQVS